MIRDLTHGWDADNTQFRARRRACTDGRDRLQDRLAVLLVEHDTDIAQQVVQALAGQPVEVHVCDDPATALLEVGRTCPDVVVLGPTAVRLGPLEFLSIVREHDPDMPVFVGAGAGSGDVAAQATELGATAVIRRPYQVGELLRMLHSFAPRPDDVELRPLIIDLGRLRVDGAMPRFWLDGREIHIPPQEFILLRYLAERVDAALSRAELNRAIWGDKLGVRSNSLTVHVMRLRKRLGDDEHDPQWIKAIRGLGYRFTVPAAVATDLTSAVPPQATPSQRSPDVHTG